MMPNSSIFRNFSIANCSLSGGRCRACACMDGPLVEMKSFTPCLGDGLENEGVVTSGNSASNLVNSLSAKAIKSR